MNRKSTVGGSSELSWFKSSYSSGGDEPDCVEVAHTRDTAHIRDSKNAQGSQLAIGDSAWVHFLEAL
ncbi:DUF397 domain-containing protein [Streptomyces sp. NPDC016845]|uniref:DUF397 domain-containing protein n=1 Tax=Streptomyces sp. NPDC016845 TaxID=3364972 RepID=UPI0037882F22